MARYIKKTEGVYVSQTWVSRLWRDNDLQPWRQGTFKISKDPRFEEKVRDVVGLYLEGYQKVPILFNLPRRASHRNNDPSRRMW